MSAGELRLKIGSIFTHGPLSFGYKNRLLAYRSGDINKNSSAYLQIQYTIYRSTAVVESDSDDLCIFLLRLKPLMK